MYNIIQKFKNVSRRLIQTYGTAGIKKHQWDSEYASGRWNFIDELPNDCVYPFVEKYAQGGSILDLGCGPGAVANALRGDTYSRYTGVDISEVAVEKARRKSASHSLESKHVFVQSDIVTFEPKETYDVILLGDSTYYLGAAQTGAALQRYSAYLKSTGIFIVRLNGYPDFIARIEDLFSVIEKHVFDQTSVIVFRPAQGAGRGIARNSK